MNNKMTTSSQLSTEPKKTRKQQKNQNQTKQTTRTETESQKWKSHGGLLAGEGEGDRGGKGTVA